eukprot:m.398557 g.398557  ORF g.398557 m.398557 type:complete len:777 (-) comp28372_c0_seq10:45-2375(-)
MGGGDAGADGPLCRRCALVDPAHPTCCCHTGHTAEPNDGSVDGVSDGSSTTLSQNVMNLPVVDIDNQPTHRPQLPPACTNGVNGKSGVLQVDAPRRNHPRQSIDREFTPMAGSHPGSGPPHADAARADGVRDHADARRHGAHPLPTGTVPNGAGPAVQHQSPRRDAGTRSSCSWEMVFVCSPHHTPMAVPTEAGSVAKMTPTELVRRYAPSGGASTAGMGAAFEVYSTAVELHGVAFQLGPRTSGNLALAPHAAVGCGHKEIVLRADTGRTVDGAAAATHGGAPQRRPYDALGSPPCSSGYSSENPSAAGTLERGARLSATDPDARGAPRQPPFVDQFADTPYETDAPYETPPGEKADGHPRQAHPRQGTDDGATADRVGSRRHAGDDRACDERRLQHSASAPAVRASTVAASQRRATSDHGLCRVALGAGEPGPAEGGTRTDRAGADASIDPVPETGSSRYRAQYKIGHGSFGTVWKGINTLTQQDVAIKLVRSKPEHRIISRMHEAELSEAQLTLHLQHAHVVLLIDSHTRPDGQETLVYEYMCDGDLFDRLDEGSVDESTSRRYMLQVADALAFIHSRDFVHNDIKLENMLLSGRNLKLCDFGLAGRMGERRAGKPHGTMPYMAPELLFASASASHTLTGALDMWSFGIVLYAVIFAELPWNQANERDVDFVSFVSHPDIHISEPWSLLHPQLRECILAMLSVSAGHRRSAVNVGIALRGPWLLDVWVGPIQPPDSDFFFFDSDSEAEAEGVTTTHARTLCHSCPSTCHSGTY